MSRRILFVDDEDWSVSPYFEILQDHDIAVDLAENGDKAMEFLRKGDYDLIVLDMMFAPGTIMGEGVQPRKSGATLLKKLRSHDIPNLQVKPDLPVLVLTAVTDQRLLDEIREMEVAAILRKPISFDEVVETVLRILGIPPGVAK
ncbi:MAG: response regulator [bacterium]